MLEFSLYHGINIIDIVSIIMSDSISLQIISYVIVNNLQGDFVDTPRCMMAAHTNVSIAFIANEMMTNLINLKQAYL